MSFTEKMSRTLLMKKPFFIFFCGQGISNIGESFRFMAVTLLLYKLTGSGVSTALSLVFSILPGILLSPFAGAFGDMFAEKHILSVIDAARAAVVIPLISENNIIHIYILLVILSALDTFYNPSRKKFIVAIAGKKSVLQANSLLTGVSGAAYLAGPILAGIIIENNGSAPAFLINCFTYMASSLSILMIHIRTVDNARRKTGSLHRQIKSEIVKGFKYISRVRPVREVILTCAAMSFCSISMNLAFYPFAFDTLGVNAKGWSFLISVYYSTNLLAMFFMILLKRRGAESLWKLLHAGLAVTAFIWLIYSFTKNLPVVLSLQFAEGTVLSICWILIVSRMQIVSEKRFMARVAGISDIMSNAGKLAGIAGTLILLSVCTYKCVFMLNSIILTAFSVSRITGSSAVMSENQ